MRYFDPGDRDRRRDRDTERQKEKEIERQRETTQIAIALPDIVPSPTTCTALLIKDSLGWETPGKLILS